MALCLGPSRPERLKNVVTFRGVVQNRKVHRLNLDPAFSQQEALQIHVPVLTDPIWVPAVYSATQRQRQRVAGIRERSCIRIGEISQLVLRSDGRRQPLYRGLGMVVLEMDDRGLPDCEMLLVLLLAASLQEMVAEGGKIGTMKLTVSISHCDNTVLAFYGIFIHKLKKALSGPPHIGRLARRLARQSWWVKRLQDVLEAASEALFQAIRFFCPSPAHVPPSQARPRSVPSQEDTVQWTRPPQPELPSPPCSWAR
mmetsp:Transcript_6170/g.14775  ORF Transcript_6170/g.14775 Transcript_6170/m.14775 type:complete len:255 (-) Transcript_6170:1486-2250(-)